MFSKIKGIGLIGWMLAIPLFLLALVILVIFFYEGRKAYWDYQVTKMCKKDGGATVFENIKVSYFEYMNLGGVNDAIPVPPEEYKNDSPYFARTVRQDIREWNPEVKKRITKIIRDVDGAILGMQISYSRIGGDLIALHPSSYSCRNVEGISLDIEKQIFIFDW